MQAKPIENKKEVVESLNHLLSDFKVMYQNLRGYHWNIKGNHFFTLHVKFEELYTQFATYIDEVAERILYLEGVPLHTFEDYLANTSVPVAKNLSDSDTIVKELLKGLDITTNSIRQLAEVASKNEDRVSEDMAVGYETAIDKSRWMFRTYLGK